MKQILDVRVMAAFHLIVVALVIIIAAGIVDARHTKQIGLLRTAIAEERSSLQELSALTYQNAADDVVADIITDCPRRVAFEELLVQLATLDTQELLRTQQLFESCGAFFAERKALMVFHIEQEFDAMQDFANVLLVLEDDQKLARELATWSDLIELQRKQRDLLKEQVEIQESIITSLIQGKRPSDPEIATQITRAQEVNELISVHGKRILSLHDTLNI